MAEISKEALVPRGGLTEGSKIIDRAGVKIQEKVIVREITKQQLLARKARLEGFLAEVNESLALM